MGRLLSQDFRTEKISEIKYGIPPVEKISGISSFRNNKISYAEIEKDSINKLYFIIERKLNDELFYWLIIPSIEAGNRIFPITPYQISKDKVTFKEEISFENNLYTLSLDLISNEDKCNYIISEFTPRKFPFDISGNIIFEILYSFYNQQITYPGVSEPKKGSELDGMCFSFSGIAKLNSNYRLELRPAFIWQSYLIGIDVGIHLRRKVTNYLFLAPGIIFHYTAHFESGGHSGWATRNGWFAFPSITLGIPLLKSIPILISYNYARINNYYNYFRSFPTQREQKNLHSIIRIGLQFGEWDF